LQDDAMSKTIRRLLALSVVLGLAACVEPFPPAYYATPAPPPLQPYMGPPVYATVAPAPVKRIIHRRYARRRHRRVHCRCIPAR
jgi:hypothetical protein